MTCFWIWCLVLIRFEALAISVILVILVIDVLLDLASGSGAALVTSLEQAD